MNTNTLTPEATYAKELAANIAAHGNPAGDLAAEIEFAHGRLQSTWLELAASTTRRAQDFRRRILAEVG